MSVVQSLHRHFKTADAKVGSGLDTQAIPFIPKASTLKTDNAQEFTLCMTISNKNFLYKYRHMPSQTGHLKMCQNGRRRCRG
eukprot:3597434-Ditylum_brightwellii.AAC.1